MTSAMTSAFELRRFTACTEFTAVAGAFLAEREAEHNLMLGLCHTIVAHPEVYRDPWFMAALDRGRVVGCAMQTPPHNVQISLTSHADAVTRDAIVCALADAILEAGPVPGLVGPSEHASVFTARWRERTHRAAELQVRQRIFRLDALIPPRASPGSWRFAEPRDRELLAAWRHAFTVEAVPEQMHVEDRYTVTDRWIRRVGRTIYLWEDGEPVAMAGAGGETPHGTRIGPVYTPPALRGRGYASNAVAAATRDQLAGGRRFCFLFTDLANPTSNKIYQQLGYQPVIDVDQYRYG